jgi:methanogenic corrinoid protein MtbC1
MILEMDEQVVKAINLPINGFQMGFLQINRIRAAEIFKNIHLKDRNFDTLEQLTMGTLESVGDGWENGQLFLSQVYMRGVICEELIDKYMPRCNPSYNNNPKMAIAVLLDHHALGKWIVFSVQMASGYDIVDFGQELSVGYE